MSLTTMYPAKNNSPATILTAELSSGGSTMTVEDPSVFPAAPNLAVLGSSDDAEIVLYTAISGNTMTIVRGQNGTTPGTWGVGTSAARNFTSQDHEAFRENILDLDTRKANTDDLGALAPLDTVDLATLVTGVLPIENGGTNAGTRIGAVQALFTDSMLNSITHILTIKDDWSMVGYASLSAVRNKLGFEDSGWVDFNASTSVWTLDATNGYFRYRTIGPLTFIYAQQLRLANDLTGSSVDLISGNNNVLPNDARPVGQTNLWAGWPTLAGGESSTIQVTTGGVLKFFKPGSLTKWSAGQNIACSGVYFNKTVLS